MIRIIPDNTDKVPAGAESFTPLSADPQPAELLLYEQTTDKNIYLNVTF